MSRALVALGAGLLVAGCASMPPLWGPRAEDVMLEDLAARGLFQGAVVIRNPGRTDYSRGFGFADVERKIPFTPETPTDGGSIAKTFTAAALLSLSGEWKVDLDAEVRKYVPDYPHAGTRVRHLLAHSAGLPGYGWLDTRFKPGDARTNASHLAAIRRETPRPAFAPGSRFEYDNVAYDVAAMIIEAVSGQRYEDYLRPRFWAPVGLKPFVRPARFADWPGERTRGYRRGPAGFVANDAIEGEGFHGAGNIYISARDLARWAASLSTLVQPLMLAEGLQPARLNDGRATGLTLLSWYVSDDGRRRYYTGHHNGFHNFAYADDERGIAIAYVANDSPPAWLQPALARALVALAEGRDSEPLVPPLSPPAATELAGTYRLDGLGDVIVRQAGRRLDVRVREVDYSGYAVEPGVFYVPGQDAYLRFGATPRSLTWDSVFRVVRGPALTP